MRRSLLLLPLLLTACQRQTLPAESLTGANAFLEKQFWGDKTRGQNLCAHRILAQQQFHVYIWELCGNFQRSTSGKIEMMAGESQPMRLNVNAAGQVMKAEQRVDAQHLSQILPPDIMTWVEWLQRDVKRHNHFVQMLENEASARFRD